MMADPLTRDPVCSDFGELGRVAAGGSILGLLAAVRMPDISVFYRFNR